MAIYPDAILKLLPENRSQPRLYATQFIAHTIVGSASSAYNYFRYGTGTESHFILPKRGAPWQLIDTVRTADAQRWGNRRAISVETEDNGNPATDPWTDSQLDWLVRLGIWAADTHNIPRRVCPDWQSPGFGWHAMWGAPSPWTSARGKSVALWTKLPTPNGFVQISNIGIGDMVFDEQGRVCNVTGVYDTTPDKAYRVIFDDGLEIIAGDDHQWSVLSNDQIYGWSRRDRERDRNRGPKPTEFPDSWAINWAKVKTTSGINNHVIPNTKPLQLPEQDLAVDPYLLGYWLGDGCERDGVIACHIDDFEWVRNRFNEAGYDNGAVQSKNNVRMFRALGFESDLRKLGVLGDKHVPHNYMWSSIDQRKQLLAGLIDSDGHAGSNGRIEFTSTREHLAESVYVLASSLGHRPRFSKGTARLNGVDCGPKYRVQWTTTRQEFELPRKQHSTSNMLRCQRRRIVSVQEIPTMRMRCITVDSPSSVYLITEGMVPTHNTCPGAIRISQYKNIVLPAIFKNQQIGDDDILAAVLQYVSKGDSGPAVYVWQRILQWIDPALLPKYGPDGDFGDETVQAIKTVLPKSDGTQINARVGSLLLALFVEARAEAAASRELDADALERRITDAVLERVGTQTGGVTADQVEAIIEDKFDNFNANIKRI